MGNLSARLAAALNRTTLLDNANQPDGENAANYYAQPRTNHYARILHSVSGGGLGYAFPYDDVHASGGVDVEGKVAGRQSRHLHHHRRLTQLSSNAAPSAMTFSFRQQGSEGRMHGSGRSPGGQARSRSEPRS